jgi:hypothetical protein
MTPALDQLDPMHARVGYGALGRGGDLGYEGKRVTVGGRGYGGALSTHPPARLLYHLGGAAQSFRCQVALNDDVPYGASSADFHVLADGREVALAASVWAGEQPREVIADVAGAELLELVVATTRWPFCHAVWLEPVLDSAPSPAVAAPLTDAIGNAAITPPPVLGSVERCIATVAGDGYEHLLDDLLGSLAAHGGHPGARVVVFLLGSALRCEHVVAKHRAIPIYVRSQRRATVASKAVLYSIARVVAAQRYICLDADTLVLDDLGPLFGAIDACPRGSILACREGNSHYFRNLEHVLVEPYGGAPHDVARLLGDDRGELDYPLVVNDGVFAGGRDALLALDATIRAMNSPGAWVAERPHMPWRNQFVFNLAMARLGAGTELDPTWNVQLHTGDVTIEDAGVRPQAVWEGRRARIVHRAGVGRHKPLVLAGRYAAVADPPPTASGPDPYDAFLVALRAWLGRHGLRALRWSFYGTIDGYGARVREPGRFPLVALLHDLVRSNGCARVLETGTARGVSTACMASAICDRPDARLVTFDVDPLPERAELWAALPPRARGAIDARTEDAVTGMRKALDAGERFHAALLDSEHTEEQLWAEFELATELVCPSGLILAHDVTWVEGLERAVARIEAAGYGVTRLWATGEEAPDDARLGLAVIENRRRPG